MHLQFRGLGVPQLLEREPQGRVAEGATGGGDVMQGSGVGFVAEHLGLYGCVCMLGWEGRCVSRRRRLACLKIRTPDLHIKCPKKDEETA